MFYFQLRHCAEFSDIHRVIDPFRNELKVSVSVYSHLRVSLFEQLSLASKIGRLPLMQPPSGAHAYVAPKQLLAETQTLAKLFNAIFCESALTISTRSGATCFGAFYVVRTSVVKVLDIRLSAAPFERRAMQLLKIVAPRGSCPCYRKN